MIALMLEANPNLSPNDVKSILMSTAQPMAGDQAGYLDTRKAVEMAIDNKINYNLHHLLWLYSRPLHHNL